MKTNWYSMVSRIQAQRNDSLPVQYILGGTVFCGMWFVVSKDVLIPREETEVLVDYASGLAGVNSALDMGTGCGNIAVTLAKRMDIRVYASDISAATLCVARQNASIYNVDRNIVFCESDWYQSIPPGPVDLIISNPPYISGDEWEMLPEEVREYEPKIALYGGAGGMRHYRKIIAGAAHFLNSGGRIVLEAGYSQAERIKDLLKGFSDITFIYDRLGIKRGISAVWKNW